MDSIEKIKKEFLEAMINSHDAEDLIKHFSDDNLLFKRVLKIIFLDKIHDYFGRDLRETDSIEEYFPRRWRVEDLKEFRLATNLDIPNMVLSSSKLNILLLSFLIPLLFFLAISFYKTELFFIPISLLGFGVYIFLATIPAIVIGLIFPKFFSPLDWPKIKNVDDFLEYLVIKNWDKYRRNSFSMTIVELKKRGYEC
ncbi:MAG: hypothetical protein O9311_18910 [Cytophagales bacterium]|nr:hypothetical protein [Cytophagales bacterium]